MTAASVAQSLSPISYWLNGSALPTALHLFSLDDFHTKQDKKKIPEREERQRGVLTGFFLVSVFSPQPSGAPLENDPLGPLPPGWGKSCSSPSLL